MEAGGVVIEAEDKRGAEDCVADEVSDEGEIDGKQVVPVGVATLFWRAL